MHSAKWPEVRETIYTVTYHNRALLRAEYVVKYKLIHDVPYTSYTNSDVTQSVISDKSHGQMRPIWALFYNHYVVLKEITSPYVEAFAKKNSPEGGGGDYGPNSGSYDQLGYGTLVYTLK